MNQAPEGYRPEIDGMRAIAILAVVFFHAKLGLPGGFVGVDIFFVISGYLITFLILRDLNRGTFSMLRFWEKRIRRILPALFAAITTTVIAAYFLLLPSDFEDFGRSVVAQAVLLANFYHHRTGGYFGTAAEEKPLLHTWSLAVEEQFYLLFPIALILIYHIFIKQRRLIISSAIAGGILLSLGLAEIVLHLNKSGAAFYLLPCRAWELLLGSLVASLPQRFIPSSRKARESLAAFGILGMAVPLFLYTKDMRFPGLAAVPPTLGAAIFIFSNSPSLDAGNNTTFSAKIISSKPVVFIGLISYSLYLWHWPIFAFSNYWHLDNPTFFWNLTWKISSIAISILLAFVSWKYIETPFRTKKLFSTRKSIYIYGTAATTASILLGFIIISTHGAPFRYGPEIQKIDSAIADKNKIKIVTPSDLKNENLVSFGIQKSGPVDIYLWGDSHAAHAVPAFDKLADNLHLSGRAIIYPSTPPLFDITFDAPEGLGSRTPEYANAVKHLIQKNHPQHVVIAGYWASYQAENPKKFEKSLIHTIETLNDLGSNVWILMDIPSYPYSVPKELAKEIIFPSKNRAYQTLSEHQKKNEIVYRLSLLNLPATFIDPIPSMVEPNSNHLITSANAIPLYRDKHHLTAWGSVEILLPVLLKHFSLKESSYSDPSEPSLLHE